MAQTKSQSPKRRTASSNSSGKRATGATSTRGKAPPKRGAASSARRGSAATRSRSRQAQASRRNGKGAASNGQSAVKRQARRAESSAKDAGQSVSSAVTSAGRNVGKVASKAKGPALASGAVAAGLAGGILIGSRGLGSKPRPGLSALKGVGKGLLEATENVGRASARVGELTEEVRLVREGIEQGGKRRSPIEVVLDGLTRRRG